METEQIPFSCEFKDDSRVKAKTRHFPIIDLVKGWVILTIRLLCPRLKCWDIMAHTGSCD